MRIIKLLNKQKYILIFVILILVLSIVTFIKITDLNQNKKAADKDFISESYEVGKEGRYWSERIDVIGTENAYKEFVTKYSHKDFTAQHVAGHLFGNLLYDKKGPESITVCDENLGFGCFHNFISRSLVEKGPKVIQKLASACQDKFGPSSGTCQHGIGHGILEYLGYTPQKLIEAINVCEEAQQKNSITGCVWGVYMAYNMRVKTSTDEAVLEWRKLDPGNPYEPCSGTFEKYQSLCYAQLGLWWDKVLNKDYQKIGKLCENITKKENRDACFYGSGLVAATLSDYDIKQALYKCRQIENGKGVVYCLAGAYRSFAYFKATKSESVKVCDGLEKEDKKICLTVKPDAGYIIKPIE